MAARHKGSIVIHTLYKKNTFSNLGMRIGRRGLGTDSLARIEKQSPAGACRGNWSGIPGEPDHSQAEADVTGCKVRCSSTSTYARLDNCANACALATRPAHLHRLAHGPAPAGLHVEDGPHLVLFEAEERGAVPEELRARHVVEHARVHPTLRRRRRLLPTFQPQSVHQVVHQLAAHKALRAPDPGPFASGNQRKLVFATHVQRVELTHCSQTKQLGEQSTMSCLL